MITASAESLAEVEEFAGFFDFDNLEGQSKRELIRSLWDKSRRGRFGSRFDRDGIPTPRKMKRDFNSRWRSKKADQFEAVIILGADRKVREFLSRFGPVSEGLYVTLFPSVTFDRKDIRRRSRVRDKLRTLVTGLPPSVADEYERTEIPMKRLENTLALAAIAAAHGEKLELHIDLPVLEQWVAEASEAIVELAPRKEILLELARRERYLKFVRNNISPHVFTADLEELLKRPLSKPISFSEFLAKAEASVISY